MNWMMGLGSGAIVLGVVLLVALIVLAVVLILRLWPGRRS
jgi:hypothetical protein